MAVNSAVPAQEKQGYLCTVRGKPGTESQARAALRRAGLEVLRPPRPREGGAAGELRCFAGHPDQAVEAVRTLGWVLYAHRTPPRPGVATESTEDMVRRIVREEMGR